MKKRALQKKSHSPNDVVRAISLFSAVRRIMRARIAEGRKLDPSTWLQIETMKFIMDHGMPKMRELADHLSITAPSATSLVGGLVKNKLVVCTIDRRDRRASRLTLTAKGKSKLKKAITRGTQLLSGLFAVLSEPELTAFMDALERIKEQSAGQ
ncbi:winged helix DNA-binding protein [Patescibacteria group bacterium]|nr:winged helix DNA-binding protein [Patescibacteria group bacterium]MDE2021341.1 winged helix DNA-binding protein [Patescibacteria group bacterium]MDE2173216.1 winged helix DNA-binding protein [Patescibacteria group bacterium]